MPDPEARTLVDQAAGVSVGTRINCTASTVGVLSRHTLQPRCIDTPPSPCSCIQTASQGFYKRLSSNIVNSNRYRPAIQIPLQSSIDCTGKGQQAIPSTSPLCQLDIHPRPTLSYSETREPVMHPRRPVPYDNSTTFHDIRVQHKRSVTRAVYIAKASVSIFADDGKLNLQVVEDLHPGCSRFQGFGAEDRCR